MMIGPFLNAATKSFLLSKHFILFHQGQLRSIFSFIFLACSRFGINIFITASIKHRGQNDILTYVIKQQLPK